jgi:PAS domain S-box-containing protein
LTDAPIRDANALKVLDTVRDGVVVMDLERKILFINKAAQQLLGYSEEEALGSRCKGINQTSECGGDCPMSQAMRADRDMGGLPMTYQTRAGSRIHCMTSVTLLRDGEGRLVGGAEIFHDISEIVRLQGAAEERYSFHNLVGGSRAMREVYDLVQLVAETDSTVLITGESGTGKELVANAIHFHSHRKGRPLVKVNCAALNEGVLESELFGHVRGSFTGAISDKAGRFETADGGTLFLDEIGEVPTPTQVKLLRVLQEGEIERVGSSKTIKADVRLIAATNRDLAKAIADGSFRSDLFYRLNVFRIAMPPLRDRREDLPALVDHFVKKIAAKMPAKKITGAQSDVLERLMGYGFPGNIRELENLVEHAAICSRDGIIRARDLPLRGDLLPVGETHLYQIRKPLEKLEKDLIQKTLEDHEWKVQQSADRLGISRVTLWRKMKDYELRKPLAR